MQNHFSRLPPKSVARQEALWQDTLREGSVRALCQGREYNSSGLTCHLKRSSPRPQFYRHNHVLAKTNGANCPAVRKVPNCSTYRPLVLQAMVRRHLLREDCGRSSVVVARDLACPRSLAYFSAPGVLYFSR